MFISLAAPTPYQPAPPPPLGARQGAPPPPQAATPAPAAPPAAPPPPVTKYWAAGKQSFMTLADVGKAVQDGTVPMQANGRLEVSKITYGDVATLKAAHDKASSNFGKSALTSLGVGIAVSMVAGPLAPLTMLAGIGLAAWNGYKAHQESQASANTTAPGYYIAEQGRMTVSPGTNPPQFSYRAVDVDKWYNNLVPDHPYSYKAAVALDKAD